MKNIKIYAKISYFIFYDYFLGWRGEGGLFILAKKQTETAATGKTAEETPGNGIHRWILHPISPGVWPGLPTVRTQYQ
jgi:hypothetical protein